MKEINIDKIIRSQRKTMALVVTADATLIVRAPLESTLEYINEVLFKRRFWIKQKKIEAIKNGGSVRSKEFVNGQGFLYLGKSYKLKIHDCDNIYLKDYLFLPSKFRTSPKEKMLEWYKIKALEKLRERAELYSNSTGWKFKSLKINNAQTRWGSCGPNGSLNFSWKLIMAPLNIIDYVVVHELAHINEMNHSVRFWNKVKTIIPDYKQREKWLKENRMSLSL